MEPLLARVRAGLEAVADPIRAPGMQAYMKSAMPYHGVASAPAKAVFQAAFANIAFPDAAAWEAAVRALWDGATHREERYAALALAGHPAGRAFRTPSALPLYEHLVVTGAWWDFIDHVAPIFLGELLREHPDATKPAMLEWSRSDDMWKRRSAIICQLGAKGDTDLGLLYACIEPALGSREFFLRKAIGWALRQHARTDDDEVRRYVASLGDRLSPLSRREALKRLS